MRIQQSQGGVKNFYKTFRNFLFSELNVVSMINMKRYTGIVDPDTKADTENAQDSS
jgi:hypothetical protein